MRIGLKWVLSIIGVLAIALPAAGQTPVEGKPGSVPAEVPKYLEVNPRIGTGGQPTTEGLQLLKKEGYKAIINLRTSDEGVDLAAESALARQLGLLYFSIPVVSTAPKDEQALEFLKLMERFKNERVFVHCASANRVGSFMMIHEAVNEKKPLAEAEEEANRIGLRSEVLRQFAREFVERHKK